jgi:uncharacterized caspase-like protein
MVLVFRARRSVLYRSALLAVLAVAVYAARGAPVSAVAQGASAASSAGRRVALVIGNSAYPEAPLRNPANDARAMADALRQVGFEVIVEMDRNRVEIRRAVRAFGDRLRAEKGEGLFFFAGHGVQVSGRNYLIPIGANIGTESDVEDEGVDVAFVLGQMEAAANSLNIVILDACRNNPFARAFRSQSRGLASIDAPTGTIIAYSTAPGSIAADGDGANSVYTQELLRHMKVPGVAIEETFKRVRIAVRQATRERQIPWESTALVGDFYFVPGDATRPVSSGPPSSPGSAPEPRSAAPPSAAAVTTTDRRGITEALSAYRSAYEAMDVDALRQVFPKFGNFEALRQTFEDLRSLSMAMNPGAAEITVRPDGTATAAVLYTMTSTSKTGSVQTTRPARATFHLRYSGGRWVIEKAELPR